MPKRFFSRKILVGAFARPEHDGARRGQKIFQQKNICDREENKMKVRLLKKLLFEKLVKKLV
jgi:hypothetical protein